MVHLKAGMTRWLAHWQRLKYRESVVRVSSESLDYLVHGFHPHKKLRQSLSFLRIVFFVLFVLLRLVQFALANGEHDVL